MKKQALTNWKSKVDMLKKKGSSKKTSVTPKIIPDIPAKPIQVELADKFNILDNTVVDTPNEELVSLIDNYFENLLYSNEKTINSDFLSQVFWFHKDFNITNIIIKHLENFLKDKKVHIRNNIKKGVFELKTGLNNLIQNYIDKITEFSIHIRDKEYIIKLALTKLYEQIISEPALINYLKIELSTLTNENKPEIKKLTLTLHTISTVNTQLKSYQWFLLLISSSILSLAQEIIDKNYPVSESFQEIIKFREILALYEKVEEYYLFVNIDTTIIETPIFNDIINIIFNYIIKIINGCSIKQVASLINNNKKLLKNIFNSPTLQTKASQDMFSTTFIKNMTKVSIDKCDLYDAINYFMSINTLVSDASKSKVIIGNQISQYISTEECQNLILRIINQSIVSNKNNQINEIINFCFYIKDKDKFVDKYNKALICRLLDKPVIGSELQVVELLARSFVNRSSSIVIYSPNFLISQIASLWNKTQKILTDASMSLKDRESFNALASINKNYNFVTSSYNNWDINQQEGVVSSDLILLNTDYELSNILYNYNQFYNDRYINKRKLLWYPHFGKITFDYLGIEMTMLPIQFMIIEYVHNQGRVSKDNLFDFSLLSGYNHSFKNALISSLLYGGILYQENDFIQISTSYNNVDNYITIFFNTTDYSNIWEKKRVDEFVLSRIDILSTWVNHFVKHTPMILAELYLKIKTRITIFDFDIGLLEEVVNIMIKKDYITYVSDKIHKIVY